MADYSGWGKGGLLAPAATVAGPGTLWEQQPQQEARTPAGVQLQPARLGWRTLIYNPVLGPRMRQSSGSPATGKRSLAPTPEGLVPAQHVSGYLKPMCPGENGRPCCRNPPGQTVSPPPKAAARGSALGAPTKGLIQTGARETLDGRAHCPTPGACEQTNGHSRFSPARGRARSGTWAVSPCSSSWSCPLSTRRSLSIAAARPPRHSEPAPRRAPRPAPVPEAPHGTGNRERPFKTTSANVRHLAPPQHRPRPYNHTPLLQTRGRQPLLLF